MKYLIWLVVLLAVVVWFQRAKKSLLAANDPAREDEEKRTSRASREQADEMPRSRRPRFRRSAEGVETMVQCAHCGIHFPLSEAVTHASGAHYCSEEHRQLASF